MSGECLLGCLWGVSVVFSGRSVGLSVHMKKAIIHRASSLCVPTSMMQFWTKTSSSDTERARVLGSTTLASPPSVWCSALISNMVIWWNMLKLKMQSFHKFCQQMLNFPVSCLQADISLRSWIIKYRFWQGCPNLVIVKLRSRTVRTQCRKHKEI